MALLVNPTRSSSAANYDPAAAVAVTVALTAGHHAQRDAPPQPLFDVLLVEFVRAVWTNSSIYAVRGCVDERTALSPCLLILLAGKARGSHGSNPRRPPPAMTHEDGGSVPGRVAGFRMSQWLKPTGRGGEVASVACYVSYSF